MEKGNRSSRSRMERNRSRSSTELFGECAVVITLPSVFRFDNCDQATGDKRSQCVPGIETGVRLQRMFGSFPYGYTVGQRRAKDETRAIQPVDAKVSAGAIDLDIQ